MEHREDLLGTERQLQRLLNPSVELRPLLRLDDWYHCDATRWQALEACTPEEAAPSSSWHPAIDLMISHAITLHAERSRNA